MTDLYATQRAMRAMRKTAMQRGVIAVLDVGTSKIACLVLRFDGTERFKAGDEIGAMAGGSGASSASAAGDGGRWAAQAGLSPLSNPHSTPAATPAAPSGRDTASMALAVAILPPSVDPPGERRGPPRPAPTSGGPCGPAGTARIGIGVMRSGDNKRD